MRRKLFARVGAWAMAVALLSGAVEAKEPLAWFETTLASPDGRAGEDFGYAVALKDGIGVVGAPLARIGALGFDQGAIYVFSRIGATWSTGERLTAGLHDDQVGYSVAISGNTILTGAFNASTSRSEVGAAYTFVQKGDAWAEEQKLVDDQGHANDFFGNAVAIDGDTAVIGNLPDTSDGAAVLFLRSGGVWKETQRVTSPHPTTTDTFAYALAVQGDALIIGAPTAVVLGQVSGAAYALTRRGDTFTDPVLVHAPKVQSGSLFGQSVSLSAGTLVVGAPIAGTGGEAYVFSASGSGWTAAQTLVGPTPGGCFGVSVAVDGDTLVVGDNCTSSDQTQAVPPGGAAYVFQRKKGAFARTRDIRFVLGSSENLGLGFDVAVSGSIALVGAFGALRSTGYAYSEAFLLPTGAACADDAACGSGYCVDSVCCDQPCDGVCQACSAKTKQLAADDGACGPANASIACSPYACSAAEACLTSCASARDCDPGYVCDPGGRCVASPAPGSGDSPGCAACAAAPGARSDGTGTPLGCALAGLLFCLRCLCGRQKA